MRTDDLDYDLPEGLIAVEPADPRDTARLMLVERLNRNGPDPNATADDAEPAVRISHHRVSDLPDLKRTDGTPLFTPGDLMICNQSRVIPAYLTMTRSATGGGLKGLFLEAGHDPDARHAIGLRWRLLIEARGTLEVGEAIELGSPERAVARLRLTEPLGRGAWWAAVEPIEPAEPRDLQPEPSTADPMALTLRLLDAAGSVPLPPYIRAARKRLGLEATGPTDRDRYNTVYARSPGSVAAPTAGLHFTPSLLRRIDASGVRREAVTLHVGEGTFAPVRVDRLADHDMHAEWLCVPGPVRRAVQETRQAGGEITCVGTTTVRALESLPAQPETPGDAPGDFITHTKLFIYPGSGFRFRFTDRLMTNFHLPRSTLLAMVASLPGMSLPILMHCYRQAIEQRYRFYSYGDAMLIV